MHSLLPLIIIICEKQKQNLHTFEAEEQKN